MRNVFALCALLFVVGCANLETTAYRTIGSVAVTVDGAMNGWGDWVRAGKASDKEQSAVKAAYEKYQSAMRVARVAVRSAKSSPEGMPALEVALQAVEHAAGELVLLISTLSRKGT